MSDVSLTDFRASVLAPWAGDESPACQAAAEAMHAVACTHARVPKGTIVIDVPDQTSVRSVTTYIEAMLKDQEQLSRLPVGWHDGEVTVAGKKVLCLPRGTSRRPRGVLARIEMRGGEVASTALPSDFELAKTFSHALITASHTGDTSMDSLAKKFGYDSAKAFAIAWDDRAAAKKIAKRRAEDEAEYDPRDPIRDYAFLKPTSVPVVARTPAPPMTREEYVTKSRLREVENIQHGRGRDAVGWGSCSVRTEVETMTKRRQSWSAAGRPSRYDLIAEEQMTSQLARYL